MTILFVNHELPKMQKLPQLIGLWSPVPGSGKSTVADFIWQEHDAQVIPFAYPLKRMVEVMLADVGYSQAEVTHFLFSAQGKKERLGRLPGAPTPRRLLQTLGTEWGRFCVHIDLWVELWRARVAASPHAYVIVDDVRFRNEAEVVRSMGGKLWCVRTSRVLASSEHLSEGQLGDEPFDVILQNDGTLEQLREIVQAALTC